MNKLKELKKNLEKAQKALDDFNLKRPQPILIQDFDIESVINICEEYLDYLESDECCKNEKETKERLFDDILNAVYPEKKKLWSFINVR